MCITFIFNGFTDPDSDYNLVIATNRDEFYDRASKNMCSWDEAPHVYGGKDMEADCQGTWLAYSSLHKKLGILLNLPGVQKPNAKSRGKLVADFIKNKIGTKSYIQNIKDYVKECNDFIFISVDFSRNSEPVIQTYDNATNKLVTWTEQNVGFSNSLPEKPMKKVEAGKKSLQEICTQYKKYEEKTLLIEQLIKLLKSDEKHLPDPELQKRRPDNYKFFSSIYVCIPSQRYGTRTHTLMLVSKKGQVDLIEITLQPPIDISNPQWKRSDLQFNMKCQL